MMLHLLHHCQTGVTVRLGRKPTCSYHPLKYDRNPQFVTLCGRIVSPCHGKLSTVYMWFTEYDDSTVDDDGEAIKGGRKRERQKKNPTFMEGISGVSPVTDMPRLGEIQQRIQRMCGWKRWGVCRRSTSILLCCTFIYSPSTNIIYIGLMEYILYCTLTCVPMGGLLIHLICAIKQSL